MKSTTHACNCCGEELHDGSAESGPPIPIEELAMLGKEVAFVSNVSEADAAGVTPSDGPPADWLLDGVTVETGPDEFTPLAELLPALNADWLYANDSPDVSESIVAALKEVIRRARAGGAPVNFHRPLTLRADRAAFIRKAIESDDGGSVAACNPQHLPETP